MRLLNSLSFHPENEPRTVRLLSCHQAHLSSDRSLAWFVALLAAELDAAAELRSGKGGVVRPAVRSRNRRLAAALAGRIGGFRENENEREREPVCAKNCTRAL
jgi:hypothetical protein